MELYFDAEKEKEEENKWKKAKEHSKKNFLT